MDKKLKKKLQQKAKSRGIAVDGSGGYERHVLFCGGPNCCHDDEDWKVWKHLQKRLEKLRKDGRNIYCTQVECLRFCCGGPLMVVYPEGVWYAEVSLEVCERIIEEHLLDGRVVDEHSIARNCLTPLGEGGRKPED